MGKTFVTLYWDGIYNIDFQGSVIPPGGPDMRPEYACNKFIAKKAGGSGSLDRNKNEVQILAPLKTLNSESVPSLATMSPNTIAIRIGRPADREAKEWIGLSTGFIPYADNVIANYKQNLKVQFIPYEGLASIPIFIDGVEQVEEIMLRIFRGVADPRQPPAFQSGFRESPDAGGLVYQEILDKKVLAGLAAMEGVTASRNACAMASSIATPPTLRQ